MTEEEMQELMNNVIQSIESYFETYDWDKAFQRHLEDK